jgi:hypothetical protein
MRANASASVTAGLVGEPRLDVDAGTRIRNQQIVGLR